MVKVLLYRAGNDLLGKCIKYFTDSEWAHVALYVGGYTFEETFPGAIKTLGEKSAQRILCHDTTLSQENKMYDWCMEAVSRHMAYNVFRLVALAFVYPLRWFFNKLNWVPFRARIFGEVCSTFVDSAFKAGGIDLFPERGEAATVPGDFINCRELF
jgi:uncharacterized protein YycO